MKKVLALVLIVSAGVLLVGFSSQKDETSYVQDDGDQVVISEQVMEVINNSCFACHNSESRNEDGKKKLSFDELNSLQTFALMGTLEEIREEVEEGKMPPARYLENNPDHALSDADKETLLAWVKETSDKISGE